jgi:hypothetical protein
MVPARDFPGDLDAVRGIARSFLVVRIVKGSLLLIFLAVALVGVELRDWPRGVSVAIALAMLMQIGALVAAWRWAKASTASPHAP